jgi:hypothetical protein
VTATSARGEHYEILVVEKFPCVRVLPAVGLDLPDDAVQVEPQVFRRIDLLPVEHLVLPAIKVHDHGRRSFEASDVNA